MTDDMQRKALAHRLKVFREYLEQSPDHYFGIGSCKVEGSFDRNYMVRDNLICMLEGIEDAICNMLEQEDKA